MDSEVGSHSVTSLGIYLTVPTIPLTNATTICDVQSRASYFSFNTYSQWVPRFAH
jgi:hypothetical protein